jgi:stringent starvation protein B
MEYVKNGEIVLNVSLNATRNLTINNELIQFSARFNGVSREVSIPGGPGPGHFRPRERPGRFLHGGVPAALAARPRGPVAAGGRCGAAQPPRRRQIALKLVK